MRKLLCALCLSVFAFSFAEAQEPAPSVAPNIRIVIPPDDSRPAPTLEDYETALDHYKALAKKSFDVEAWKNMELKNKKTGEVLKFQDLEAFDQHVFFLLHADRLSKSLTALNGFWVKELEKFDDPAYAPIARENVENDKQKPALKEDVAKYMGELDKLRKDFAVQYEKFADNMFQRFKTEMTPAEREFYTKQIKDFHDRHKLVEREK